jgi:hypothetical protein
MMEHVVNGTKKGLYAKNSGGSDNRFEDNWYPTNTPIKPPTPHANPKKEYTNCRCDGFVSLAMNSLAVETLPLHTPLTMRNRTAKKKLEHNPCNIIQKHSAKPVNMTVNRLSKRSEIAPCMYPEMICGGMKQANNIHSASVCTDGGTP